MKPGVKRKGAGKPRRDDRKGDRRPSRPSRNKKPSEDVVTGRNSVVEALRAKIPAKELFGTFQSEIR